MLADLQQLARRQCGVFTRAQAVACVGRPELERRVASGEWRVLRRGTYAPAVTCERVGLPLLDGAARLRGTSGDAVVSHESAAAAYGLPLLDRLTGPPRITVATPGTASAGNASGRYLAPLPAAHRRVLRGVPLTSPARTVADLCRTGRVPVARVVADGALRLGLGRQDVLDVLAGCRRWPYVRTARIVLEQATPWAESPLESLALHWCRLQGLPMPAQQLTVRTAEGRFVARVDIVWEEYATVGELDGRLKYAADGQRTPESVLWAEKRREDRLRDEGLQVVRGYWSDAFDDGAAWAARVRRAFARSATYVGTPTYRVVDERDHARRGPLAA